RCFVLPRLRQGSDTPPGWSSGFSWHEMAGGILTSSRTAFDQLDQPTITSELKQSTEQSQEFF
ncbi:MAG TPA: hypothetical protein HPP65_07785, partial [Gammaproteobacteria bacterium]|nr:hypothetical protein [Gammaproteobacteria bacterium]